MSTRSSLRLGIVPYLNVLPLIETLEDHFPAPRSGTPRELAEWLKNKELDIAIQPVFASFQQPGLRLIPGCAIACDGPVRSVQLFSRVPLEEIRTVTLDKSSLSSIHLAQILCRELLRVDPEYVTSDEPLTPESDAGFGADAAIVAIGDTALAWEGRFPHRLDLGAGWKELTGLPFVFAGWFARPDVEISSRVVEALNQCRRAGERNVYDIALRNSSRHDREVRDLVDYLSRSIKYRLNTKEMEAIHLYRLKLIANGLLPKDAPAPVVWQPGENDQDESGGDSCWQVDAVCGA